MRAIRGNVTASSVNVCRRKVSRTARRIAVFSLVGWATRMRTTQDLNLKIEGVVLGFSADRDTASVRESGSGNVVELSCTKIQ